MNVDLTTEIYDFLDESMGAIDKTSVRSGFTDICSYLPQTKAEAATSAEIWSEDWMIFANTAEAAQIIVDWMEVYFDEYMIFCIDLVTGGNFDKNGPFGSYAIFPW